VGQGFSLVFALLSVLAVAVVLYWLFVKRYANSLWLTICLGLLMGGTLGNLYDRLGLHGITNESGAAQYAVRDFLHFTLWGYDWPVFNFADVFLVTGAIMLALHTLFVPEVKQQDSPAAASRNQTAADAAEIRAVS
jgi:signal peptidase II